MVTLFDVICEQHEKKEAFKNKIVEKRLQKKNLKRVVLLRMAKKFITSISVVSNMVSLPPPK